MKIPTMKLLFLNSIKSTSLLLLAALVLLASCSPREQAVPQSTETPAPAPFDVTYCDINPADVCLEGFGLDIEERLLVLFHVTDEAYTDIYMLSDGPDGEIFFECQQSKNFPENVYCLGESFPEGELIKLNIYSNINKALLAIGVFNVEYADLPESDVVFHADATPSPEPSYPNPSYPNPSYPNPNTTP